MEQNYTFKTKRPDDLNERIAHNSNIFIHYDIGLDNKVAISPNTEYREQEIIRLTNYFSYLIRLVFLFNTQKTIELYVLELNNRNKIANNLYKQQSNSINQQIQQKEEEIEENDRLLTEFNKDQKAAVKRKEFEKDQQEFLLMIGDDDAAEAKLEKEKILAIEIKTEETELNMKKRYERQNLDLLKKLKEKLEKELTGKINDTNKLYKETLKFHQAVMLFLEEQRHLLATSYESDQLNQRIAQIQQYQQGNDNIFKNFLTCYNDYCYITEQINIELKKIENNQQITLYTIKFEVAVVEEPMQKIKIKQITKKIAENEDRLPALKALDSIITLQNSVALIYQNFRHIDNNKPSLSWLNNGNVNVPTYYFTKVNVYRDQPSLATQNLERQIKNLKDMKNYFEDRLNDQKKFKDILTTLYTKPQQIDREAYENHNNVQQINNGRYQQLKQLIGISEQEIVQYTINRQQLKAFIGCMAQFLCVKKDVCLMCCRCCYSKDLHNYTDIYKKDYLRIIAKHYQVNNNEQRPISIHQVQQFRLVHVPQLLLDLEFVGAYRNDHGGRQRLEFEFRFNDITKSITYTGFEICNLLVLQEMMGLNYNVIDQVKKYEQIDQAIEMGELSVGVLVQQITPLT